MTTTADLDMRDRHRLVPLPGRRAFGKAVDMLENPPLSGTPAQIVNHTLRALTYGVLALYEATTEADE